MDDLFFLLHREGHVQAVGLESRAHQKASMEVKLAGQFELGEPDGQAIRLEYEAALAGHLRIAGKPPGQAGTFAQGAFPPCINWRQHKLFKEAVRYVGNFIFCDELTAKPHHA
ncbi:hypothetical protein ACK31P_17840 [Aeromonas caviae]